VKRILVLCTLVLLCGAGNASAEQRVSVSRGSFSDTGENRIETWMGEWMSSLPNGWQMTLRGLLDHVQLPPLPGLPGSPENLDAITTASRPIANTNVSKLDFEKRRREVSGGVSWQPAHGAWAVGSNYYHSMESDWLGQQLGVHVQRNLAQGSTNLAFGVAHGWDTITPDLDADGVRDTRRRHTNDLTFVWTQSLTQRTQVALGAETTWVHGFLANPYRQVYAGGAQHPETHPESRFRRALFGRVDRWLMTRASVSLAARWYGDDWGVQSGTMDLRLNQYVGDHLIVRYRYRYYNQTAASFYRDLYESATGIDGWMTADYKLNNFDSSLFGVKMTVPFEGLGVHALLAGVVLDAKYERYFDSQSFGADVFESGLTWSF